jgi:hypothetical protein
VGEFVGKQQFSRGSMGRVLVRAEDHVVTEGVGAGVDGPGGLPSRFIGVHADMAEVESEARLEESAGGGIEWKAGGAERGIDYGRSLGGRFGAGGGAMQCAFPLLLAGLALGAGAATGALAAQGRGRRGEAQRWRGGLGERHAQYGFGDAVGLALVGVPAWLTVSFSCRRGTLASSGSMVRGAAAGREARESRTPAPANGLLFLTGSENMVSAQEDRLAIFYAIGRDSEIAR